MKLRTKIITSILFFLFICIFALAVLKKGDKFHSFSLKSIDDKIVTVKLEDSKLSIITEFIKDGKKIKKKSYPDAILLDFWATWCVPCRAAMPYMQKIYEKYQPKEDQIRGGLELLGIALDRRGSKVVKPFFKKFKISYAMLADPTTGSNDEGLIRTTKDMKSRYRVQEIPVVYLIDSKGIIEHVHVGFKKRQIADLENTIKEIISGERE